MGPRVIYLASLLLHIAVEGAEVNVPVAGPAPGCAVDSEDVGLLQGPQRFKAPESVSLTSNLGGSEVVRALPYVLQAFCGPEKVTSCNLIPAGWQQITGAFDYDINKQPPAATGDPKNNFVNAGEDYNNKNNVITAGTMESWLPAANAANFAFTSEIFKEVEGIANEIRKTDDTAKFQITCLNGTQKDMALMQDSFDYIGIEFYANSIPEICDRCMTEQGWTIPVDDPKSGTTYKAFQTWDASSVDNSKIVLGMTTSGLEGYMVDMYKAAVKQFGFAGILVWHLDHMPLSIPLACFESYDVSCSGGPPKIGAAN